MPFLQPHMVCYGSNHSLVLNEALSNFAIFTAYSSLSVLILYLTRKTKTPYTPLWYGFVAFIGLCGLTHLFHLLTLFSTRLFLLQGIVEDITAMVSWSVLIAGLLYLPDLKRFLVSPNDDDELASIRTIQTETKEITRSNSLRVATYTHRSSIHGV